LRSKIRIEGGREKPIDFLAKVILVIEGKLPVPIEFLGDNFKDSFMLIELLPLAELKDLLTEIETFQQIDTKNKRF
jgi:hypothetical protein